MDGCTKEATRYAGLYALRLIVMIVVLLVLCWYLLDTYAATLPSDTDADIMGLASRIFVYVPPLLLTIPLAFVAGYFPVGSMNRLISRMILNIYLIIVTLFITSDLSFTLEDVQLLKSPDIYADTISLSVDAKITGYILLLIPTCSMVDALLEYRCGKNENHR